MATKTTDSKTSSASMGKGGGYMPSKATTPSKTSSASLGKGGGGFAANPKGSLGPTRGNGSNYGLESAVRSPSYQGNMARPIQTANMFKPQRATAVPGGYGAQAFGMATPSQLPRPNISQPQVMHPVNSAWRVGPTGPVGQPSVYKPNTAGVGGRALLTNGSSLGPTRGNGSNYAVDSGVRLPSFNGNVAGPVAPARPPITVANQTAPHKEYYDRIQLEPTYRSQAYNANVVDMAKNHGDYRPAPNFDPVQFAARTTGYQSAIDAARAGQDQSYPAGYNPNGPETPATGLGASPAVYRVSPTSSQPAAPSVHPEWQADANQSMGGKRLPNYGLGTGTGDLTRSRIGAGIGKISAPWSVAGLLAKAMRGPLSNSTGDGGQGRGWASAGQDGNNFGQDVHSGGGENANPLGFNQRTASAPDFFGNQGHGAGVDPAILQSLIELLGNIDTSSPDFSAWINKFFGQSQGPTSRVARA